MKILIVEDSFVIANLFELIFKNLFIAEKISEYEIIKCDSVGSFYENELDKKIYDIALFDWMLYGQTSREIIKKLKNNNAIIYGVMITGYCGDPSIENVRKEFSLDEIYYKPVGPYALKRIMNNYKERIIEQSR